MYRYQQRQGFTVVELLIVIVVVAIIAAITIVTFNGTQVRAENSRVLSEASSWKKAILMYRT